MRQMMAILWESYRMLRARVLFWVVLGISVFAATMFASIGVTDNGYSMLFGLWEVQSDMVNAKSGYAELFYLVIFTNVMVKWWLGYLAIALALISCSSIFPEFLSAGSVDVAVSKPISRTRLFLIKYMGSLLFVFLQVGVFALIVFLALGIRLGHWNWSVFWSVPILVFVFSMIYCFGVLVSVWTRSTMLSLLAMLILWGVTLMVQWTEGMLYGLSYSSADAGQRVDLQTGQVVDAEESEFDGMKKAYRVCKMVAWPLPKTREATLLINEKIKTDQSNQSLSGMSLFAFSSENMMEDFQGASAKKAASRHSLFYVLGSSALFEIFVLSLACWKFSRKDY